MSDAKPQPQQFERVVYRVDVTIDVPSTRQRNMAVFEASRQWPEIEDQLRALAADVRVRSIAVLKPGDATADDAEAEAGDDADEGQD